MSTTEVTPVVEPVAEAQAEPKVVAPPEPPPTRSVYRVNYYVGGSIVSAFVVAYHASEAIEFLGVRDSTATASQVANPVEVVGVDAAHAALPLIPVTVNPPAPSPQLTDAELAKLRQLLAQ